MTRPQHATDPARAGRTGALPGMTAPAETPTVTGAEIDAAEVEVGPNVDGEMALRFPVLVLEGVETSDGRYLTAGGITHRALPLSLLACPESAHGGNDPDAAVVVGRIDTLTRTAGADVVSKRTGEPFPPDSFVWSATGAMYADVTVGKFNIGDLVRRRFLRGVSVDLAGMDVELIGDEQLAESDHPRRQMIAHSAEIAAVTLVPIPAFGDAYVELADDLEPSEPVALSELPDGLAASAFPAWRSAEVGDPVALVADGEPHTGGMIALLPASPDELTVEGGDPTEDMHLTLAYLGEDVTGWDDTTRAELLGGVEQTAASMAPVEAEVMGHALFNPTGAHDRDPCAVYLVSGPGLREARDAVSDRDMSDHPIWIPHVTAGYGLEPSALSFVGPVVFDRIRVALADEVTDYPLAAGAVAAEIEDAAVVAAVDPDPGSVPDAPQFCAGGSPEHPAVRSLLFDARQQYAPTCDEHEPDARAEIEAGGFEVEQVVEIPTVDDQEMTQ